MNNLFRVLVFILILSMCAFCQAVITPPLVKKFILANLSIGKETNPSLQEESTEIDFILNKIVGNIDKKNKGYTVRALFNLLYKNATSIFSDTPEIRCYAHRRATIFAMMAICADYDRSFTFINYAKFSLMNGPRIEEFLESEFCGLLILQLLLEYKNGAVGSRDELDDFLIAHKQGLDSATIEDGKKILEIFKADLSSEP